MPDQAVAPRDRTSRLRPFLKWVRYALERWLHPIRRRAAQRRLERQPLPSAVLVVCQGNICRSPFAAAGITQRLTHSTTAAIQVDSAGFVGPGRPSPAEAVATASRYGIDLRGHRSKLLDRGELTRFDLVVVMDTSQRRRLEERFGVPGTRILILGDLDPGSIETRAIIDPIDRTIGIYEQVYQRIDRCIGRLAAALQRPD